MHLIPDLSGIAWLVSLLCTCNTAYYLVISLFSFRTPPKLPDTSVYNRFLILIAARNEETVIGELLDSLSRQNYPRECFDICVIPNNCTDRTREVSLARGAQVFDCSGPVRTKGDALHQVLDALLQSDETYDAFCVIDADNLVHPDFLAAMNRALASGHPVAQGFRDCKNPADSMLTSSNSIYYWMFNRFYNRPRRHLGLSAIISGSGFMMSCELLRRLGGWQTHTLTEDMEMTAQCVLAGETVTFVPEARIYDELPLTFAQSWQQRLRWTSGTWQIARDYGKRLLRKAFRQRGFAALDLLIFYLAPAMQLVYTLSIGVTGLLQMMMVHYALFPESHIYQLLFLSMDISYMSTALVALATVLLEKKQKAGVIKGIFYYWIFVTSWLFITLQSTFRKATVWTPIAHTRAMRLNEILMQNIDADQG